MTDMTTDKPGAGQLPRAPVTEYRVYFAIIFALALVPALLAWLRSALTGDPKGVRRGVLERARTEAATITPLIFSA